MSRRPFLWWRKNREKSDLVINGQKVVLREKKQQDAADDYRWRTDKELSQLDDTKPLTMSYSDFLELFKEELRHSSIWSCRLGVYTLDDKHIGNCMYYDMDHLRQQTEVGIMIGDKSYWDQGYGTDALITLVEFIFHSTSVTRVYLHTLEWNSRARSAFAKAGFSEVKRVIRGGNMFVQMEIWRNGAGR